MQVGAVREVICWAEAAAKGVNAACNEETEQNYKQQINYLPQKENVLSFKLVVPVSLVLYNTHLRQRLTGCPNL